MRKGFVWTINLLIILFVLFLLVDPAFSLEPWSQINTTDFGDTNNIVGYAIAENDGYLYVGTRNTTTGGEVW